MQLFINIKSIQVLNLFSLCVGGTTASIIYDCGPKRLAPIKKMLCNMLVDKLLVIILLVILILKI